MDDTLKGRLLVSSPSLLDPNFRRTIVLVTEHNDEGAMGLVLNRAAETTVAEAVPQLAPLVADEEPVHVGGPVEPGAVMALAEWDEPEEAAALVFEDVGFVPAEGDSVLVAASTRRVRVFAGYAGWGAGQLDSEVAEDAWIVLAPDADDVFGDAEATWARVLRRQGGAYRLLALMPDDPSVN
jgi:putative transcriptional regulator